MLAFDTPVKVYDKPFRWALISGVLPEESATMLRSAFPSNLSHTIRNAGSDKTYSLHHRLLTAPDGIWTFSTPWSEFVQTVTSWEYRKFIQEIGQIDMREVFLEIALNSYSGGGYMSPHTDRWPKLATHVIYLPDRWQADWGGHLHILEGPDPDPVHRISPAWPTSVLLVRSDNSWHEVERVSAHARLARQTIQISLWAEQPPAPAVGRVMLS